MPVEIALPNPATRHAQAPACRERSHVELSHAPRTFGTNRDFADRART